MIRWPPGFTLTHTPLPASPPFQPAAGKYLPRGIGEPERLRIEIGGGRHRDRGKTDEAVERRDELRHRGHRDAARHDDADDGTDRNRCENLAQIGRASCRERVCQYV